MNKPEAIVKIEAYIAGKEEELDVLEGRLSNLEKQRPMVSFKGEEAIINKLNLSIIQVAKDMNFISDQIKGARQQLDSEIQKWIEEEEGKWRKSAQEKEEEAKTLHAEIIKHLDAIKKLCGQEAVFFGSDKKVCKKVADLRWSAQVNRNQIEYVRGDIEKQCSNNKRLL